MLAHSSWWIAAALAWIRFSRVRLPHIYINCLKWMLLAFQTALVHTVSQTLEWNMAMQLQWFAEVKCGAEFGWLPLVSHPFMCDTYSTLRQAVCSSLSAECRDGTGGPTGVYSYQQCTCLMPLWVVKFESCSLPKCSDVRCLVGSEYISRIVNVCFSLDCFKNNWFSSRGS
jgi:hypothetical protein